MGINEMSDQEKSIMLARLCGWDVEYSPDNVIIRSTTEVFRVTLMSPNYLYNTKWMFLAWRVLNWAHAQTTGYFEDHPLLLMLHNVDETLPPAEAQRLWLDKILELAIEAGMVKEA